MTRRLGARFCVCGAVLWVGASACGRSRAGEEHGQSGGAGGPSGGQHSGGGTHGGGRDGGGAGATPSGGVGNRPGTAGAQGGAGAVSNRGGGGNVESTAGGGAGANGEAGTAGDGGAEFGCRMVACEEETLAGSCPAQPPESGSPCSEIGSTCSYCAASTACPSDEYGYILQCCDGTWGHNCYENCTGEPLGPGGQGGQGGGSAGGSGGDACVALLSGCCTGDGDCPPGFECANEPADAHAGVCRSRLADSSRCWVDADCPKDYRCNGALYCGCGRECSDEFPGDCTPR